MTDQEINEAVARKLGGEPMPPKYDGTIDWAFGRHEEIWGGKKQLIWKEHKLLPNYCHSIEAAWEIVESHKGAFSLATTISAWSCRMQSSDHEKNAHATADTSPMAICLAFLELEEKGI